METLLRKEDIKVADKLLTRPAARQGQPFERLAVFVLPVILP
jgi:hypothetical protein